MECYYKKKVNLNWQIASPNNFEYSSSYKHLNSVYNLVSFIQCNKKGIVIEYLTSGWMRSSVVNFMIIKVSRISTLTNTYMCKDPGIDMYDELI